MIAVVLCIDTGAIAIGESGGTATRALGTHAIGGADFATGTAIFVVGGKVFAGGLTTAMSGGASLVTGATMGGIAGQIGAFTTAIGFAIFAGNTANAFDTDLTGFAEVATLSAVFGVGFGVGADTVAEDGVGRALAGSGFAILACGTGGVAFSAVFGVNLCVDTIAGTIGQSCLTGKGAFADGTHFTVFALCATGSAVVAIDLGVGTFSGTDDLTGGTKEFAFTSFAAFTIFAFVIALAAVFGGDFQIDAFSTAFVGTVRTVEGTFSGFTDLPLSASGATLPAIFPIGVDIGTSVIADRFSGITLQFAFGCFTNFPGSTGDTTAATVFAIDLCIDTGCPTQCFVACIDTDPILAHFSRWTCHAITQVGGSGVASTANGQNPDQTENRTKCKGLSKFFHHRSSLLYKDGAKSWHHTSWDRLSQSLWV